MRRGSESSFERLVNHRGVDRRREGETRIDVDLDEVDPVQGRVANHIFSTFLRRLDVHRRVLQDFLRRLRVLDGSPRAPHRRTGHIHPRAIERTLLREIDLFIAHLDDFQNLSRGVETAVDAFAEGVDGGDAVVGPNPKLRNQSVTIGQCGRFVEPARGIFRAHFVPTLESDVTVGADEPGRDGLAGDIDADRAGRDRHGGRRTGSLHAAIPDDHRRLLDGRTSRAVDQACASQDGGGGGCVCRARTRKLKGGRYEHERRAGEDRRQTCRDTNHVAPRTCRMRLVLLPILLRTAAGLTRPWRSLFLWRASRKKVMN